MCRLQGEPGAQTDALIVCGLERCHAGLTEAEMERPTSVIALCPNFFPWHREPCCEKMGAIFFTSPVLIILRGKRGGGEKKEQRKRGRKYQIG